MAGIGQLVGFLRLDDAQYNRAAKSAAVTARAVATGVRNAFLSVAAPTVLATRLLGLGRSALNLADNFEELAERTGASFEGIQVLGQLARSTGQKAEVFTGAIDRLNINLAEMAAGSLKTYGAVRTLGLTLKDFEGLTAERKLELIAQASARATDRVAAFNAVGELLGTKTTPQLRSALDQLARGYTTVRDEAAQAGQIMSERIGKDLARAKGDFEAWGNWLTIKSASILRGIFSRIEEMQAASTAPLTAASQDMITNEAIKNIVERTYQISTTSARDVLLAEFKAREAELYSIIQSQTMAQMDQRSPITKAESARLAGDLKILHAIQGMMRDMQAESFGAIMTENNAAAEQAARAAEEEAKRAAAAAAEEAARLRALAREQGIAKTGAEGLALRLTQLARAQRDGSISAEAYARAVEDARAAAHPFKTAAQETAVAVRELNRLWQDGLIGAQSYSRAYQDILLNLRPIKDPLEQYRAELTKLHRLQQDSAISAGALALAVRDAARAAGSANLAKVQEGIDAAAGGRPGGSNISRSAQKALDRAQQNAARGNLGAAQADLRRVNELTGGQRLTTLEDLLAPKGARPLSPIAPPERKESTPADEAKLVQSVDKLVEQLTAVAEKLTVA